MTGLPAAIRDAVVAHMLEGRPNEACGVIVGDGPAAEGGRPLRFVPARNALASPYRFEVHPDDLLRLVLDTERVGGSFWAIVHSHLRTEAAPSPTDLALAAYPEALQLIVSLRHCGDAAEVSAGGISRTDVSRADISRAELALWRLVEGRALPVPLRIDG